MGGLPNNGVTRTAAGKIAAMRAAAWGIERTYVDYRGARRTAPAEAIERIGRAMGAAGDKPPPGGLRFARAGEPLRVRRGERVVLEDGTEPAPGDEELRSLPAGYHEVETARGERERLIASPGACHLPERLRIWGWAVQLYSARSRRSWGIGDLGDLRSLGRWATRAGAGAILVNPLNAPVPGTPQEASPYYPSSRCGMNPLYIRIEDVPGAGRIRGVERLARTGRALGSDRTIDRDRVYELKMDALDKIWSQRATPDVPATFVERGGRTLRDFVAFMTACEIHGRDPRKWPAGVRSPDAPGIERWRVTHADRIRFHTWLQWLLDEQLRRAARACPLITDLPVGVDPAGADAWMWNDVFAPDVTVGAPPDEFNTKGQDWGLPPFDPWKLRGAGYEPLIQTLRAALRHASGIRIDHVMGLFRLYWVPSGHDPSAGAYVRYPYRELLDIVALESARAAAYVVGEDLGTVEPRVRDEMAARRMLSYRLMLFEDAPPRSYPELALAAVTSHDLPTVAGLWTGDDLAEQRRMDLDPNEAAVEQARAKIKKSARVSDDASAADVIERTYRSLATAPSKIVMATLEDAAAAAERPNHPGITGEGRNWSLALPVGIEQLRRRSLPRSIAAWLGRRRRQRPEK